MRKIGIPLVRLRWQILVLQIKSRSNCVEKFILINISKANLSNNRELPKAPNSNTLSLARPITHLARDDFLKAQSFQPPASGIKSKRHVATRNQFGRRRLIWKRRREHFDVYTGSNLTSTSVWLWKQRCGNRLQPERRRLRRRQSRWLRY